jgi:hypothetical protein
MALSLRFVKPREAFEVPFSPFSSAGARLSIVTDAGAADAIPVPAPTKAPTMVQS